MGEEKFSNAEGVSASAVAPRLARVARPSRGRCFGGQGIGLPTEARRALSH